VRAGWRDIDRFHRTQACPEVRSLLRLTAVDVFARPAHVVAQIRAALQRLRTAGWVRRSECRARV